MPIGTHTFEYRLGKEFFAEMESSDILDADLDVALTVVHKSDVYEDKAVCSSSESPLPCEN